MDLEERLRWACRWAVANGWRMKHRLTVDAVGNRCCPIGAAAVCAIGDRSRLLSLTNVEDASDAAGLPFDDYGAAGDFADGFDAGRAGSDASEEWRMGARLRI